MPAKAVTAAIRSSDRRKRAFVVPDGFAPVNELKRWHLKGQGITALYTVWKPECIAMNDVNPVSVTDLDPAKVSAAASHTFENIVRDWELSQSEAMTLLGYDEKNRSTYYKWKKEPASVKLPKEKLERLSYIFGIYKALQILLPNANSADEWLKKPNTAPLFNGQSALSRMLSGLVSDLYVVRQYLDAQRGW